MDENNWVPYAQRKEWADVTPLPQDDGDDPVVRIAYDKKYIDVYDYFRAIYKSKEVSLRALDLTKDAAELNPANYTVWHHRRFLLKALLDQEKDVDLRDELDYIREVIEEHPKNYQVWQHRQAIVDWLQDPSKELRFCAIILSQDAKNYHAWQYRQWVIRTFNLYDDEIEFIDFLLDVDLCNNSAWNQRFFVVSRSAPNGKIGGEKLAKEFDYVKTAISKMTANESSWNYLRGLMDNCEESEATSLRKSALEFCRSLQREGESNNSFLLAAVVDLLTEKLDETYPKEESETNEAILQEAQTICKDLAEKHDVIRREYWMFMQRDLSERFGNK